MIKFIRPQQMKVNDIVKSLNGIWSTRVVTKMLTFCLSYQSTKQVGRKSSQLVYFFMTTFILPSTGAFRHDFYFAFYRGLQA